MRERTVGFIGFGNMAQAMAKGFLRAGYPGEKLFACARHFEKLERTAAGLGVVPCKTAEEVVTHSEVVIAAVKPYLMKDVFAPLKKPLQGKVLVSVAAGWGFDRLEALTGPKVRHISTMPNTPVAVGKGVVLLEERHSLTEEEHRDVFELLSLLGLAETLPESQFNAAGKVTGCGPAFAAMFLEALGDAAVTHGVPRTAAYRLAAKMLEGTAALQLETGDHPGAMKDAVCSPNGSTILGVAQLEREGFRAAVLDAVDATMKR